MTPFLTLLLRDVRLSLRHGSDVLTTLFFFLLVACLFGIALGGTPEVLATAATGIVWVAALLAALLSLENIWHRDAEDGSLDLMLLSSMPPFTIIAAKMLAHWILSGAFLIVVALIAAHMLYLPSEKIGIFAASLLTGTLYMSLLGGMGAVMTMGARRPGMLLALLVLPLYVPMLILGILAVESDVGTPYLLLQAALLLLALPLTPLAAAAFLKMHQRSS